MWRSSRNCEPLNGDQEEDVERKMNIIDPSARLQEEEQKFAQKSRELIENTSAPIISFCVSLLPWGVECEPWNEEDNVQNLMGCMLDLLELLCYLENNEGNSPGFSVQINFLVRVVAKFYTSSELLGFSQVDGNLEEAEFPTFIHRNSRALGCLWLLLLRYHHVECVYSMEYILRGCSVHILSLLQAELPVVVSHGMKLLNLILSTLPDNSLHIQNELCTESHVYILIFQELVNSMSKHPQRNERQKLYETFCTFLHCFSESSQFYVLSVLIRHCPYVSIKGELIHQLKENVHRIWKAPESSPAKKLVFQSPLLLQQITFLQNKPSEPTGKLDQVINYLNLIRFLYLVDNEKKELPIWNPYFKRQLLENYLHPQMKHAKESLQQHYLSLDSPAHAQQSLKSLDSIASNEMGLPSLSQEEFSVGTMRSVMDLELVADLSSRVIELLQD